MKEVFLLDGETFPEGREHFGFRESIAQPAIIGSGVIGIRNDNIEPGEFIMGYKNEYDVYPDTPLLKENQGNVQMLSNDPEGTVIKTLAGTEHILYFASSKKM